MNNMIKKTIVIGAITLSVASLGAQPTFAAENIFQRLQSSVRSKLDGFYLRWVPGTKSGPLVLKKMSESYSTLKSFESDTTIDAEFVGSGLPLGSAKITAAGPTTVGDVWNPKTYNQDLKVAGSVSFEGTSLSATAEIKMIDGVTYVLFSQVPTFPGLPFDVSAIKNTWVKMDPAAAGSSEQVAPTAEQQQQMQAAMQKLLEGSQVSDAYPEKKDDESTYRLELVLSKPAVVEYLVEVGQIQNPGQLSVEEARANSEKMLANVGDLKATLWVERTNYYPTFFELPLEINAQKLAESGSALAPSAAAVEKINIKLSADLRKFNESFTITAPESAEDMQLFMQRLMGGVGGPAVGVGTGAPSMLRQPTVGTSELPELTEWQKQQIELYENR